MPERIGWTGEEAVRFVKMREDGFSVPEIVEMMPRRGFPKRTEQAYWDAWRRNPRVRRARYGDPQEEDEPTISKMQKNADGTSMVVSNRPLSDEEIFDLWGMDPDCWIIKKKITNTWAKNWQTKVWWEPVEPNTMARELWDELLAEVRERSPQRSAPAPEKRGDAMVELCLFDAHFQSLCWGAETGEDYDLGIAADRYRRAAYDLIRRCRESFAVDQWRFIVGQDLFHSNNAFGTTQRGTQQDIDSRWQKSFIVVRRLLVDLISEMSREGVEVVIVPGNHGPEKTFYMGEVLDAEFHGDFRVAVDNSPSPHKFKVWRNTLVMYTHGDGVKAQDLPPAAAAMEPELWGQAEHREARVGHKHHEEVKEFRGMTVRRVNALAGTDAWHGKNLFVGTRRGAQAFVWTEDGLYDTKYHNVRRRDG